MFLLIFYLIVVSEQSRHFSQPLAERVHRFFQAMSKPDRTSSAGPKRPLPTAASDTTSDGGTTVVARNDVESLGGTEDSSHLGVQVEELHIRFFADLGLTLGAVYHATRDECVT